MRCSPPLRVKKPEVGTKRVDKDEFIWLKVLGQICNVGRKKEGRVEGGRQTESLWVDYIERIWWEYWLMNDAKVTDIK